MIRTILLVSALCLCIALPMVLTAADEKPVAKEDPAATKLLAEAIAARAVWKDFPGFTADLEVNRDGKIVKGSVEVSAKGKVEVKIKDEGKEADKLASKAKETLASVVGHRLPSD